MENCDICRQTADVHGHATGCPRASASPVNLALRQVRVTDQERTDLLLRLGDALTANANLQHELTELTNECSRLDAELCGLAAVLRPVLQRRECLCIRGDDGLYAHPRCTVVHDEQCVGVVRLERV